VNSNVRHPARNSRNSKNASNSNFDFEENSAINLVGEDLDVVDLPEGFVEGGWVVLGEGLAAPFSGALGGKDGSGPVSTESEVNNHVHVGEVVGAAASSQIKIGVWFAPSGGVGVVTGEVTRDSALLEEERSDKSSRPFQGIHAASAIVEACSVRVVRVYDSASLVSGFAWGIDVAVGGGCSVRARGPMPSELAGSAGDCATIAGVESRLVGVLQIDPLDDVDFSAIGPVGSHEPPRRPCGATRRHVNEVGNKEAGVPGLVGRDANGVAAASRGHVFAIRTDNNFPWGGVD